MSENSPLSTRELFEFDLRGFVIFRNFLPVEVVSRFNEIIDTSPSADVQGKFPYLHLDPSFLDLMTHPRVMQICDYLLGKWFRFDHAFGLQYGPNVETSGQRGTPGLHAGPFESQGVFRYSWFNNRPQCGLIVFDYFLKRVNEGDGGLLLMPGSHKLNVPMSGREVFRNLLKCSTSSPWLFNPAMEPGDLLVFTEAVIHGTQAWQPNERGRRNLHMSFSPGFQAQRNPTELDKIRSLAKTELEKGLLRPAFASSFDDSGPKMSENIWREPTLKPK